LIIFGKHIAERPSRQTIGLLESQAWLSAHRGKWGQLTPWKMDAKLQSENVQKREQFSMLTVYFESNHSGQAGVENGAMLTTYLFRYTSECTIS